MKPDHAHLLACPECKGGLTLAPGFVAAGESVETGKLVCARCPAEFAILRHIPRFVPLDNYASGFGLEWTKHARTQYDSHTGANISETRFFDETKWPRDLRGETLLEAGSGSGRFTEQAARTGATVVSIDYSVAVEANYASNGAKSNVLIVQGDIYRLPVREAFFDKVLCIGVLQHTPDPEKSFLTLAGFLKPGGRLTVDVYKRNDSLRGWIGKLFATKYFVRPFTRRMEPHDLYRRVTAYINFVWPLARLLNRIPRLGRWLNWRLLVADYRGVFDLPEAMLKEWAILDTFDMLSPRYDYPQTLDTLRSWFAKAGLVDVEVHYGYNGIEGRGQRPTGVRAEQTPSR
jgi:2-polyprenyl-3-methyl-5-hydroxy-6-metoxy-1,4-benzoquinol methylase/uncharacterized protein YbaR (Trm112 family)